MRYRNAPAAINWLCTAFGFEKKLVVPGPNETIAHAELTCGHGMMMLGSVAKDNLPYLMKQPDEIDGAQTATVYVVVSNVGAVYARAKAAGAVMVVELEAKDFGGEAFTCRDVEGHIWNFGSYDPWTEEAV